MATAPIETKPAAGLLGGAIATVAVGALARYTSYNPGPDEVGGIVVIAGFAVAWLVPSRLWDRYSGEASRAEVDAVAGEPHEPTA